MTAFRLCNALAFAVVPAAAAEPKPNLPAVTGPLRQLVAVLEKVTDEKTAAEAKPKVDDLWAKHAEAMKTHLAAVAAVPTGQQATLLEAAGKELAVLNKSLRAEHDRVFSNRKAAYKLLKETALFASLEAGMEREAVDGAVLLQTAAQMYRLKPASNGAFPVKTSDVAKLLQDGEKRLLDPWGAPYRYEPPADPKSPRPHLWTVSPYSGKKLGFPPPDEK